MSLASLLKGVTQHTDQVFASVPAFYGAGANTIAVIFGGPILIKLMVEYCDVGMTNATSTTITASGVACDAGAVLINGTPLGLSLSPLGAVAKVATVLATTYPNAAGVATNGGFGLVAAPGNIVVTFGGAAMAAADRYSLHIVYQKLSLLAGIR
jgi:hypothetical protein